MQFCILILILVSTALADPRMWEHAGLILRGEGSVAAAASATNPDGQTLIVWIDRESGSGDVWAQLLSPTGAHLWEAHGRRIIATEETEQTVQVYPWHDNFVLTFTRPTGLSTTSAFMLPIDLEGNAVWPENNGSGIQISHSGAANVHISSVEFSTSEELTVTYYEYDLWHEAAAAFVQRVSASGEFIWNQPLELLPMGYSDGVRTSADPSGNLYAAISDRLNTDSTIYRVRKFDGSASLIWETEFFSASEIHSAEVDILAFGDQGFYLTWAGDSAHPASLMLQKHDNNGDPIWPNSVVVDSDWIRGRGLQLLPSTTNAQIDGVILSWQESSNLPADSGAMRVQKVSNGGDVLWESDGRSLCGGIGVVSTVWGLRLINDLEGGLIAAMTMWLPFNQHRSYQTNVTRLNAAGEFQWGEPCGVVLTTLEENISGAIVTVGNPDFITCTWHTYTDTNVVKTVMLSNLTGLPIEPNADRIWASGLSGSAYNIMTVPLLNGRAAVVWQDSRAHANTYYQIVDQYGETELEQFGRRAFESDSIPDATYTDVCSDGLGGFYIVIGWESGSLGYVHAARVRSDGSRVGNVLIASALSNYPDMQPRCVPGLDESCFVVWQERDLNEPQKVYMTLIDSSLSSSWSDPLLVGEFSSSYILNDVGATPEGSCAVVWASDDNIREVTVVSSAGEVEWETEVCNKADNFSQAAVAVDTNGEIFVAWQDERDDNYLTPDIYGQKLSPDGVPQLTDSGVLLATHTSDFLQKPVTLVIDDGVWLVYAHDDGSIDNTLYANKFDESFVSIWSDTGVALSTGQSTVFRYSAVADGTGGLMVAWASELEFGGSIAYAKHLNGQGNLTDDYWSGIGGVICDVQASQYAPVLTRGANSGEFFCFWSDMRTAGQLFGQYLDEEPTSARIPKPPIASRLTLAQNYPNPFNASTEIVFNLPRAMNAVLQVFDVTGRLVETLADQPFAAGEQRVMFDASVLASGIYFYELRAEEVKIARKMLLLK